MPGIIAGVLISFFAIVGLAEVGRGVMKYLLTPKPGNGAIIVTCKGHDEQIEYYLRSLANQADEYRFLNRPHIIVIDAGMDDETRSICESLARDIDGIAICKTNELPMIVSSELQN